MLTDIEFLDEVLSWDMLTDFDKTMLISIKNKLVEGQKPTDNTGSPPCPEDCFYRHGRSCIVGDHCTRRAVDLYTKQQKDSE